MQSIRVIKKEDVLKRLDDPDIDYIERHIKSLRAFIEKRPERREVIIEKLSQIPVAGVELKQANAVN
jgi:hypothetical protein